MNWLRNILARLLVPEIERKIRFARLEQSAIGAYEAHLNALQAWRDGNAALQARWTQELTRRMEARQRMMEDFERDYGVIVTEKQP